MSSRDHSKKHHVFIQYRPEMVYDDWIETHAVYTGQHDGLMHAHSRRQSIVYSDTAPHEKLRPEDEMLNSTILSGVSDYVIKYCEPGDLFVVLVHNLNHALHHPRDRDRLIDLHAVFRCDISDIEVVEVVVGLDGTGGNVQPLLSFLGNPKESLEDE